MTQVTVPIDGSHQLIFTEASKIYRLHFSGLADCQTGLGGLVDALWWKKDGQTWTYNAGGPDPNHARLVWNKTGGAPPQQPLNELTHEYNYVAVQGGIGGVDANWDFWFDDGLYSNNSGTLYVEIEEERAAPSNTGDPFCPFCYSGEISVGRNPVGIRNGEKREQVTDLSVTTPAGPLAFTRTYRQSKQAQYQFMGLGWTHNLGASLTSITGTPNKIVVQLPNGGEGQYTETSPGSNQYTGLPGVGSSVTWDSGTSIYTLTAPDQSTLVFDSTGKLIAQHWPNNEIWTYTYTNGLLAQVADDYNRFLQFAYVNNPGQFDHNQFWRVGDHTAGGLTTSTPTGRYVEFGYTPEKSNGVTISSPRALLATVRDVRGNLWTYDYFGQHAGETDALKLNFLASYSSPSVDTTGDGTADGNITRKRITYVALSDRISSVSEELGLQGSDPALLQMDYQFIAGTLGDTTTETIAGKTKTYEFDGEVYTGQSDPQGNRVQQNINDQYRPDGQTDANGNETQLAWSDDGTHLNGITDALNHSTSFHYNTDGTLDYSVDGEQRKTLYVYNSGFRQPTAVLVAQQIASELALSGDMEATTGWASVGTPLNNERSAAQVDSGVYSRWVKTDAVSEGIESATWSMLAGRTYLIKAQVYVVNGTVKAKFSGVTASEMVSNTTGSWQTLRLLYISSSAVPSVKLQFLSTSANAEFYVDSVHLVEVDQLLDWQEFEYDVRSRVLAERKIDVSNSALRDEVIRAYATSGNGSGLLESLTRKDLLNPANDVSTTYTYDSAGRVVKTQQSSLLGSCQVSYTVYDAAGSIVASICNYDNAGAAPTTADEAAALYNIATPDQNRATTYAYDPLNRRIKTVTHAGIGANAVYAQATLTVYDALDRVVRTIGNYVADVSIPNPYTAAQSAFNHGADNNQNLVTDTVYNTRGLVRKQVDVLGNVTLYGYDDADRLLKTIQNASQPNYNNDYSGTAFDPLLANYAPNTNADQDIVTTQGYDANGNLVQTVDALGNVAYTVYDALNSPVKTVRSAKDAATLSLNPGDAGYSSANDPRSGSYVPSTDPDRDLIETTEYDTMGRVIRTQRLMENRPATVWDVTLYGYDPLGRQVKVIGSASNPTYSISTDPDLSGYSPSANADQDLITTTTYDTQGRVLFIEDVLGSKTRWVYDGLSRQVKTIANFVDQGEDPTLWVWSSANNRWQKSGGTAIDHGAKNDQNVITETIYDSDGRVQETRDVLGRITHNVYDGVGRLIRSIANYVPQGTSDPKDWIWNNGWKQGGSGAPAVSNGVDNDENILANTAYDALGRVSQTTDHRNNATLYFYDVIGRRVKAVANYLVQGTSAPASWLWSVPNSRWEDGAGNAISFGTDKDQNHITTTIYDLAGRVTHTRDAAGVETRSEYDALGRRTKTIANYVDGVFSTSVPDEDLISTIAYNKGGQVVSTTDVRGTQTAFTYDQTGRRLSVTQAAGSPLATVAYTCFDKAGRTLRTISNWANNPTKPAPDARDGSGAWLFVPEHNGQLNDRDLVTLNEYDLASRQTKVTDPLGNFTMTAYFKDGQAQSTTDPEGMVTAYRYDAVRRRIRVVQSFVDQGEDPSLWVWNSGWKKSNGTTAIVHGTNNDQNVIVDLALDRVGRMTSQRDPRGNLTTYAYDQLNRRKTLTNPLSKVWTTAYADLTSGKTQTTMTMPGITGTANYQVQRQFDRLRRASNIAYGDPAITPDVTFTYDSAGNRTQMTETGSSSTIRETNYAYDDLHRLTSVGFDNDGSGSVDQVVSYQYDAGGLRTKLTLPGSLNVVYTYDQRGQLVSLTDWDSQTSQFAYDNVGRHIATERANGLRSRYEYDAASRLRALRHTNGSKTFAQFIYEVDARGNRIRAQETLVHPPSSSTVTIAYNDTSIVMLGTWANVSSYKESTALRASLLVGFFGNAATLTMGTGSDHSLYDIYIDGSLWQSFDGYGAGTDRVIQVTTEVNSKLTHEGLHILEIRNRIENPSRTRVRFKQLLIGDQAYDLQTISYGYDALSRLKEARYAPGVNASALDADLLRRYQYTYDLAGNRLSESLALNGASPTVTSYTYNTANQLTSDGTNTLTYDANGNLLDDGPNTYVWDRANRLLSMGGHSYTHDGAGNRITQTVGATVTQYLLDLQPGLATVLAATAGANTTRYIHSPHGIHAHQDASNNWEWMVQDGLGSVRGVIANSLTPLESREYSPYGEWIQLSGTDQTPYGFTGEPTDNNALLYLRARSYAPGLGVFTARDPFEGMVQRPMSLNGYSWVEGNVINRSDPSGMIMENPAIWDRCSRSFAKSLQDLTTIPCILFDAGGSYVTISTTAAQVARGERALFQTFITVNNLADMITGVGGIVGATCQFGRGDAGRGLFTLSLTAISVLGGLPGAVVAAYITAIDLAMTMLGIDLYDLLPGIDSSIPNSSGICSSSVQGGRITAGDQIGYTFISMLNLGNDEVSGWRRPIYPPESTGPIDVLLNDPMFEADVARLALETDFQNATARLNVMKSSISSYLGRFAYFTDDLTEHSELFDVIVLYAMYHNLPNFEPHLMGETAVIYALAQEGVLNVGDIVQTLRSGPYQSPPC